MKKRILSIVLTLCMVLMLVPATAFAEGGISHEGWTELTQDILENYKVESAGTHHYSLPSGSYYLDKDILVNLTVRIGNGFSAADVTLDLNGYKLTKDGAGVLFSISCSTNGSTATLTLTDSSSSKKGMVINGSDQAVRMGTNSILNANGGTVEGHIYIGDNNNVIYNTDPSNVTVFTGSVDNRGTIKGGIYYGTVSDSGTIADSAKVTVSFDSDNGNTVQNEKVLRGQKVNEPTIPTKDGYEFAGWYTDETFTNQYNFEDYVTGNITLYAGWDEIITVTVPFTTTVELGGNVAPGETTFNLEVVSPSGDKISSDDVEITAESVTTNGAKSYDGTLSITGTSEDIADMLSGEVFVKQAEGKYPDWVVDDTVWCLVWKDEIVALDADDTALGDTILIYPTGFEESEDGDRYYYPDLNKKPVDQMSFTNTYTKTAVKPADSGDSADTGDSTNLPLLIGLMLPERFPQEPLAITSEMSIASG